MAHPQGGSGSKFNTVHTFSQAYASVGPQGITFLSTTNEQITARQGFTRGKSAATIVFRGQRNRHGSVCEACWGFRVDCNGSRIGQCAEPLEAVISRYTKDSQAKERPANPQTAARPRIQDRYQDEIVTADDLARWRRRLLRLLDSLEGVSPSRDGPAGRINRLSRDGRIPREIASCMRLVAEMRNVTEYQGKQLSPLETAAAKNSWLAIEAWARESNITYVP